MTHTAQYAKHMPWILLILAGLCEIIWATSLKYTQGFTQLIPSIITLAGMVASIWLLAVAMHTLPLGTAYAVWVGIGTLGTFIAGIVLFGESMNGLRVGSVLFIILGLIGLKLSPM